MKIARRANAGIDSGGWLSPAGTVEPNAGGCTRRRRLGKRAPQPSLRDSGFFVMTVPALTRRAIVTCPFGTGKR